MNNKAKGNTNLNSNARQSNNSSSSMYRVTNPWAIIIFYGAIWGIVEATLGFVLHKSLAPFTGLMLFPIGFICMRLGEKASGLRLAPMYIAFAAAAIKLLDLLVPGAMWLQVVNPAMAILLEGAFVAIFMSASAKLSLPRTAIASFGWRLVFIGYLFILASIGYKIRLFQGGQSAIITYLTIDGLANAALVYALAFFLKGSAFTGRREATLGGVKRLVYHPISAFAMLAIALGTTWVM